MKIITQLTDQGLIKSLSADGVAVLRTDTLYGIVASVASETAVQKIYDLKQRQTDKACIVLIATESQILPGTQWDEAHQRLADKYWPGPVTIISPVDASVPTFVTRGHDSLAYRLPNLPNLQALIEKTGPLIAPSANPESQTPAATIEQAIEYFGDQVDFYVDGGRCANTVASRIVRLTDNKEETLR